jgi:hypothetical protein
MNGSAGFARAANLSKIRWGARGGPSAAPRAPVGGRPRPPTLFSG